MKKIALLILSLFLSLSMLDVPAPLAGEEEKWAIPFHEGVRALREGRFKEAINNFQIAIYANPDATQPYVAIRSAYGQMGVNRSAGAGDMVDLTEARKALDTGELDQAETILSKLLRDHFANPRTHALLRGVYVRGGKQNEASLELKIFSGLLDAILATGDGKTPESAFLVQSISEEYLVVMRLGCETGGQTLVAINGRSYDVLTAWCGWRRRPAYFDISAFHSTDPTVRRKVYRYDLSLENGAEITDLQGQLQNRANRKLLWEWVWHALDLGTLTVLLWVLYRCASRYVHGLRAFFSGAQPARALWKPLVIQVSLFLLGCSFVVVYVFYIDLYIRLLAPVILLVWLFEAGVYIYLWSRRFIKVPAET